jgi:hypothetical protein
VLTGTFHVVPPPWGRRRTAPTIPVVSEKSAALTPVTDSLNVTVKFTVAALVGSASARMIDETVGAVLSIV